MTDNMVEVSDETFAKEVTSSERPVLLDFWAPWCPPCRMVAPVLEALAADYAGKVTIAKLNVDDNPRTAAAFGVASIPTMILFKKGEVVDVIVGAQPRASIEGVIKKHIAA
jgi:thioredoxin 1